MKEQEKKLIADTTVLGSENSENLVLFLHGMDSNILKSKGLISIVEEQLSPVRILVPQLPLAWHRLYDFKELGRQILTLLDDEIEKHTGGGFQRVYLIGHSAGGVLAQIVYILARLSGSDTGLRGMEADRIQMVLLAPITRGWEISHHLPVTYKIAWSLGLLLMTPAHFIAKTAKRRDWDAWLLQIRRGSPLITWLRLHWLKLQEELPLVVQLLGSKDEIVSWRDMVDASSMSRAIFYDVPYSNHAELIEFDHETLGDARKTIFRNALKPDLNQPKENDFRIHSLEDNKVYPILPWDEEPIPPDPNVKRVVFVIHGIRDEGHWTQKIANRARAVFSAEGEGNRDQIAVETSSYGYFSMLQFLLPWERRKKVAWLVDIYIEARRRYPKANFSYIGHSHGTYIAAKALALHEEISFERIAFAGSVVNRNYAWTPLLDAGRVRNVLNFSASADWVVGIFPKLAQIKPIGYLMGPDLGSAGCAPFKDSDDPRVNNNEYMRGAHSVAIEEDNWDELARFVVKNEIPAENTPNYTKKPSLLFRGVTGWIFCIGVWGLLLYLGLYHLPKVAMFYPVKFWGIGLGGTIGAVLIVSAIHPLVRTRDLKFREKFLKLSSLFLASTLLTILAFWCWLGFQEIPSYQQIITDFMQTRSAAPISGADNATTLLKQGVSNGKIQMISVVAYFWVLWNALTKV